MSYYPSGGTVTNAAIIAAGGEVTANKDAANGYAGLTAGTLLKVAELPFTGCKVRRNAAQTIANNTPAAVILTTVDVDPSGFWAGGTPTRLTVPVGLGGKYLWMACVGYVASALGIRSVIPKINGVDPNREQVQYAPTPASVCIIEGMALLTLAAGDYVEAWTNQSSGGNLDTLADITLVELIRVGS